MNIATGGQAGIKKAAAARGKVLRQKNDKKNDKKIER